MRTRADVFIVCMIYRLKVRFSLTVLKEGVWIQPPWRNDPSNHPCPANDRLLRKGEQKFRSWVSGLSKDQSKEDIYALTCGYLDARPYQTLVISQCMKSQLRKGTHGRPQCSGLDPCSSSYWHSLVQLCVVLQSCSPSWCLGRRQSNWHSAHCNAHRRIFVRKLTTRLSISLRTSSNCGESVLKRIVLACNHSWTCSTRSLAKPSRYRVKSSIHSRSNVSERLSNMSHVATRSESERSCSSHCPCCALVSVGK